MRPLIVIPLVFSLIAWILVLLAVIAGTSSMKGYYAVGFNTSKVGVDLLSTTNLFNFDESNVLFTLLFPNGANVPSYGNADATARAAAQNPKLVKRQIARKPYEGMTNMISAPLDAAWEAMADSFQIDRNGFVYGAVKRTISKASTDLEKETNSYVSRVQEILYKDVTGAMTAEFGKMSAGLPIPASLLGSLVAPGVLPAPGAIPALQARSADAQEGGELGESDDMENMHTFAKRYEQLNEHQRRALMEDRAEQIKKIIIRDLRNVPVPKQGSTIEGLLEGTNLSALAGGAITTGVQTIVGSGTQLVKDFDDPATSNIAAVVVKDSGPYVSWAARDFANGLLNENLPYIKRGFNVQDYYAFYQSRFCYGALTKDGPKERGCKTTAYIQDGNMATRVNNTVKQYGANRQVPKSMPLGKNLNDAMAGIKNFTAKIWMVDIVCAVVTGLAFFASLIALVMPHSLEWIMDLIGISALVGGVLLGLMSTSANFLLIQAINIILPGLLRTVSAENMAGWKFVTLLFVGLVFEAVALCFWVWLAIRNIRARAIASAASSAPVSHTTHYSPSSSRDDAPTGVEKA